MKQNTQAILILLPNQATTAVSILLCVPCNTTEFQQRQSHWNLTVSVEDSLVY